MKSWQRRVGVGVGATFALVVLALGGIYGMSAAAVGPNQGAEPHPFNGAIGNAPEGARLANVYGCTHCHAPDLGGSPLMDEMPVAVVPAPNLTAGAPGGALSDVAFEQGVRHGIGRDGRKLFIMPSSEYTYLSDQDVADILAWLRTMPAVERDLPQRQFGPIGRVMTALGKVPFQADLIAADPEARHLDRPVADATLELGHYMTRLCIGCHGLDLTGGQPMEPGAPPAPNLTPAGNLAQWTWEDFQHLMTTGRTPEGREVSPAMPWQAVGQASPEELAAIWAYLQSIPAAGVSAQQ